MSTKHSARRQLGLSMVELIMFIVIIGIAVVGVVRVLSMTTSMSVDPVRRKQALAIAETLLEEVQLARFTYCDGLDPQGANAGSAVVGIDGVGCSSGKLEDAGQESGGVGRPYDNVNDYVSAYGTPNPNAFLAGGVLSDANGNALASGYAASVTITATDTLGGIVSTATPASTEVLRIAVTVSFDNTSITLDGYRTRYAPTSMP